MVSENLGRQLSSSADNISGFVKSRIAEVSISIFEYVIGEIGNDTLSQLLFVAGTPPDLKFVSLMQDWNKLYGNIRHLEFALTAYGEQVERAAVDKTTIDMKSMVKHFDAVYGSVKSVKQVCSQTMQAHAQDLNSKSWNDFQIYTTKGAISSILHARCGQMN